MPGLRHPITRAIPPNQNPAKASSKTSPRYGKYGSTQARATLASVQSRCLRWKVPAGWARLIAIAWPCPDG